ncbi:MAG: aminotransferase class V-fold PLP-dependent enzyme, partial [Lactobacillus iners]|nr:aminotransferase class V-fold PLP-dependent enzyme [Lactobacillus iners]
MDKIDIEKIRNDFPILKKKINDEKLIYLDNAATVQIPKEVLTACDTFYHDAYSNVHRSSHTLAIKATQIYETVRKKVQKFINAADTSEIIFTSGCTASLNLVALSWGESFISAGDEIVITAMEHHSNLIPWQQLALRKKAKLKFIELTPNGRLDMNDAVQKITSKTKLVAAVHVSNVLGVINPIKKLASLAHKVGAIMVVDGAQAVGH